MMQANDLGSDKSRLLKLTDVTKFNLNLVGAAVARAGDGQELMVGRAGGEANKRAESKAVATARGV
jgi:hypothetical protein